MKNVLLLIVGSELLAGGLQATAQELLAKTTQRELAETGNTQATCVADTDDDGVPDGADACPLEATAGTRR